VGNEREKEGRRGAWDSTGGMFDSAVGTARKQNCLSLLGSKAVSRFSPKMPAKNTATSLEIAKVAPSVCDGRRQIHTGRRAVGVREISGCRDVSAPIYRPWLPKNMEGTVTGVLVYPVARGMSSSFSTFPSAQANDRCSHTLPDQRSVLSISLLPPISPHSHVPSVCTLCTHVCTVHTCCIAASLHRTTKGPSSDCCISLQFSQELGVIALPSIATWLLGT